MFFRSFIILSLTFLSIWDNLWSSTYHKIIHCFPLIIYFPYIYYMGLSCILPGNYPGSSLGMTNPPVWTGEWRIIGDFPYYPSGEVVGISPVIYPGIPWLFPVPRELPRKLTIIPLWYLYCSPFLGNLLGNHQYLPMIPHSREFPRNSLTITWGFPIPG